MQEKPYIAVVEDHAYQFHTLYEAVRWLDDYNTDEKFIAIRLEEERKYRLPRLEDGDLSNELSTF